MVYRIAGCNCKCVCEVSDLNRVGLTQEPLCLISVEQKHFHLLPFVPIGNSFLELWLVSENCFSSLAENCFGIDIPSESGVMCISKEQLECYIEWNTQ